MAPPSPPGREPLPYPDGSSPDGPPYTGLARLALPSSSHRPADSGRTDHTPVPPPADDLPFARLLALVGLAILVLAGLLLALPALLEGSPLVFLIAFAIAALFGPVGFSLLGAAWRIRGRALHGAHAPPGRRRRQRILGLLLFGVGLLIGLGGFGPSGMLSRALDWIWGLSLAIYGLRLLVRSLAADEE